MWGEHEGIQWGSPEARIGRRGSWLVPQPSSAAARSTSRPCSVVEAGLHAVSADSTVRNSAAHAMSMGNAGSGRGWAAGSGGSAQRVNSLGIECVVSPSHDKSGGLMPPGSHPSSVFVDVSSPRILSPVRLLGHPLALDLPRRFLYPVAQRDRLTGLHRAHRICAYPARRNPCRSAHLAFWS